MNKVLILGGYGNFGKRIARLLTRQNISVIIAGRSKEKAMQELYNLGTKRAEMVVFDVKTELGKAIRSLKPKVVINTCGPFQNSDYSAAEICIAHKVHYIDLSDGRDFVSGISVLDEAAKEAGVAVITGASSVPCLSSAVIENNLHFFSRIDEVKYGIAPGQRSERGLATTEAILSYVGKRLRPCVGFPKRYGWQDMYLQEYPVIGRRFMSNCDVPDLDLLPEKYGIKKIQFSAGIESYVIHLSMWVLSWLIRLGVPIDLVRYANPLLKLSKFFDIFGSSDGGMHMIIKGIDKMNQRFVREWFIIALDGDGPYIPAVPSVVLTKKLLRDDLRVTGAMPCVGLVTLDEYLRELSHLNIQTIDR